METRAGYLAVGVAVLAILLFGIAFIFWMAGQSGVAGHARYWADFDGSVAGLRPGSTVAYRGISVGEVKELRIRPDNVEQVRVTIEVADTTPIKTDTVASLEIEGIAGGALIQLTGGTQEAADLPKPEEGLPIIPTKPSSLQKLVQGAPALVDQVNQVVGRTMLLLDDTNLRKVAQILDNSEQLTENLKKASAPAVDVVVQARDTLENVDVAVDRINGLIATAEKDLVPAVTDAADALNNTNKALVQAAEALVQVKEAARQIGDASAELDAMIAENRGPIRDFTNVTLYDTNAFIAEVRELVINLRQITNDLNRDPSGFILGNQKRGYEAR